MCFRKVIQKFKMSIKVAGLVSVRAKRVNAKVRENLRFTISNVSLELAKVSRITLLRIVTEIRSYQKLRVRFVPKMLTDVGTDQRMASARVFLDLFNHKKDKFLSRIIIGDET